MERKLEEGLDSPEAAAAGDLHQGLAVSVVTQRPSFSQTKNPRLRRITLGLSLHFSLPQS
jgi:hypothetical protein